MATQVGYALGLLFFVPLGDVLERRALMMKMYGAVALALLLVAVAPSLSLADRGQRADRHVRVGNSCGAADRAGPGRRTSSAAARSAP